jgi:hypothetical protein
MPFDLERIRGMTSRLADLAHDHGGELMRWEAVRPMSPQHERFSRPLRGTAGAIVGLDIALIAAGIAFRLIALVIAAAVLAVSEAAVWVVARRRSSGATS